MTVTYIFEDNFFLNFYISETVRARAKMCGETFVDFDISYRIVPLQNLYSVTLTYFLKVKILKLLYL